MINNVVIMGRLTKDPELKTTQSGLSVVSFTVAVDRNCQKDGERRADFLNVVAWRQTAEFVEKYFAKGSMIAIQGSIQTRKYEDKSGNKRTSVEIVADNVWQAKRKCPGLIIFPPNFPLYVRFSRLVREILLEYTNQLEPFGIDECWIDVTGSEGLFGRSETLAKEIQQRIWKELGITVSIGASWNKVTAKLGSDYRKPHGLTMLSKSNYKAIVYPLPASDLLYVGAATMRKLRNYGIYTIGELATAPDSTLHGIFGKIGLILKQFALGNDQSPVSPYGSEIVIKSVGNSTTTPRDLETDEDVKLVYYVLAESVARRMRELGYKGRTVCISVRDNALSSFTRQGKVPHYTNISSEIEEKAMELFRANYRWERPIRSIGVSVTDFEHDSICTQLDFYTDEGKREKLEALDRAVDGLKQRFGNFAVQRATLLKDKTLTQFNPYEDHTIHPVGYL